MSLHKPTRRSTLLLGAALGAINLSGFAYAADISILNIAYLPTREL